MPTLAYTGYAEMMKALPATSKEIAAKVGLKPLPVAGIMRRAWALGLAHPGATIKTGSNGAHTVVWMPGEGERAPTAKVQKPAHPRGVLIGFAYIWRALEDGATVPAIAQATGIERHSIYEVLRALKGRVYVSGWECDAMGRPVAVWTHGTARNVPKPTRSRSEKGKDYRRRLQMRILAQFGPNAIRHRKAGANLNVYEDAA